MNIHAVLMQPIFIHQPFNLFLLSVFLKWLLFVLGLKCVSKPFNSLDSSDLLYVRFSTDCFKTVQTSDTAVEGNVSKMVPDWETLPRAWEWIIQCLDSNHQLTSQPCFTTFLHNQTLWRENNQRP